MSPTNGGMAAIRNQRKNELPLILPTTPPARPKKKAMTTKAKLEQRPHRPDHGDDRDDHHQEVRDARDDPDDDLEEDPRRKGEDDGREDPRAERRAGVLVLHPPQGTPARGRGGPCSVVGAAQVLEARATRAATVELEAGEPVAADLRGVGI